jgi:arylsulfatase A-like enzyme
MTIDLLPTIAGLIGAKLPAHPIDGKDIWPVLSGQPGAKCPHEAYFFYAGEELQAVLSGDWKLHFAHEYLSPASPPGKDGKPANFANLKPESMTLSGIRGIASRHGYLVKQTELALYNLKDDIGETTNVADRHLHVVKRLQGLAEKTRAELGDALTKQKGRGVRPVGRVAEK